MPPADRNAASDMPVLPRIISPTSAKVIRMPLAINEPLTAIEPRCSDDDTIVKAINIAASSIGRMVVKNVVSAIAAVSTRRGKLYPKCRDTSLNIRGIVTKMGRDT